LSSGALVDYPDLRKPLGPPKGAYQRTTPGGWEFTREFEHASVWVSTETREAKITWRDPGERGGHPDDGQCTGEQAQSSGGTLRQH